MPSLADNIRLEILEVLNDLKTSAVLSGVIENDGKKLLQEIAIPSYPSAILNLPSIRSNYLTNNQHLREYVFRVLLIQKEENISTPTTMLDLADNFITAFDNKITLEGAADGGITPVTGEPEPILTVGGRWVVLPITIVARGVQDLHFN